MLKEVNDNIRTKSKDLVSYYNNNNNNFVHKTTNVPFDGVIPN